MKSKQAEQSREPRYDEYHIEKIRRRYLFCQLWSMVSVNRMGQSDCVISDEEIEPHPRRRRDVIVDLLRDDILEPLDSIQTSSPKVFGVTDNCVRGVAEFTPPVGWTLDLGTSTRVRSWEHIPPSRELWAAAGALSEGIANLVLEEIGGVQRLLVEFEDAETPIVGGPDAAVDEKISQPPG